MKKRNLALGAVGAIGGLVAWKMLTRAGDVSWDDIVHKIHHAENSHFVVVDGVRVHYRNYRIIFAPNQKGWLIDQMRVGFNSGSVPITRRC